MIPKFTWTSVEEFLKANGKEETLSCLSVGWKQKQYRKLQNMKNQVAVELAKKDPRFKEAIKAGVEQKKKTA